MNKNNRCRLWAVAFVFSARIVSAEIGEIRATAEPASPPVAKDGSTLWLKTGTRIASLLIDPEGHRTGVDPKTWKVLEEIPGSSCDADFSPNPYTGAEHAEARERMTLIPAKKGIYQLVLQGLQSGPYEIEVHSLSLEGSSLPGKDLEGVISEGEQKVLTMTFDPAPNSEVTFLEVQKSVLERHPVPNRN